MLSHYDGVIWYTGDDNVVRETGWAGGNAARLAKDESLEFRAYLNEGGRVLYTGKKPAKQYTGAAPVGTQRFDPKGEDQCAPRPSGIRGAACCCAGRSSAAISSTTRSSTGSAASCRSATTGPTRGDLFDANGVDDPFTGLSWGFNGPDSANNQSTSSSFVTTSGILPPAQFPQFSSWPSTRWDKPGGPFAPHTGDQYVYSQLADVSYKRLTREIPVPAAGGDLTFWTSYDTEEHWDFLTVEARTAGGEDWTTLPEGRRTHVEGHRRELQRNPAVGGRCIRSSITTRRSRARRPTCRPGRRGEWNVASGNSNGWQQWTIDLDAYANSTVEISIAFISDWATQNLGVFIDDVTLPDGTFTSFESGFEGWEVSGPPEGSGTNSNDWTVTDADGFPVGSTISTPDSLMMGYGFEGISTQAERNLVMERVLDHLLD